MNEELQTMMKSMMDHLGAMAPDEKAQACAAMMPQMMSTMMQGMMGGGAHGPQDMQAKMHDMMSNMMAKMSSQQSGDGMAKMHEMMLTMMMPHCIGMILPDIAPDDRAAAVAPLLHEIVEHGTAGMSDDQRKTFRKQVKKALKSKKRK